MADSAPPPEQDDPGAIIPEHLLEGSGLPSSMLMRLLRPRSARRILDVPQQDMGLAEHQPFPFMAIVGQTEMRTALLLAAINPNVGGVLLIGPRGTGKTTAARGLSDLLPQVDRSACLYGDLPEQCELMGEDGRCETCRANLAEPATLSHREPVRMVELPITARIEDVIGGINERIAIQENRVRLDRGILSRADQNVLYIDEVNLLEDSLVDAILDASAQGQYTVRRGPMRATYRARFVLIGSMNPEEGRLRPQILDRFGLRVVVDGLTDQEERLHVYERMLAYRGNPRGFIAAYDDETWLAQQDVIAARERLPQVRLSPQAQKLGLDLVHELKIPSQRAEFTLFEGARAYAAADSRDEVTLEDIITIAPLALRMRRSEFIEQFMQGQTDEDRLIAETITRLNGGAV